MLGRVAFDSEMHPWLSAGPNFSVLRPRFPESLLFNRNRLQFFAGLALLLLGCVGSVCWPKNIVWAYGLLWTMVGFVAFWYGLANLCTLGLVGFCCEV